MKRCVSRIIRALFLVAIAASTSCSIGTSFPNEARTSVFVGLLQNRCVLAQLAKVVKFTCDWDAPTNLKKTQRVHYVLYGDKDFTNVVARTDNLNYELDVTKTNLQVLGARAEIDGVLTDNMNTVEIFPHGSQNTGGAPNFYGLLMATAASHRSILLKWQLCTPGPCMYNIYSTKDLTVPIGTTLSDRYFVYKDGPNDLTPNTYYSFVVRAVGSNGVEDLNQVVQGDRTYPTVVPLFEGPTSIDRRYGKAGLTQLTLKWAPKAGEKYTGFRIFYAQVRDLPPVPVYSYQTAPTLQFTQMRFDSGLYPGVVNGDPVVGDYFPSTVTSLTVKNLNANTQYYFIVKAFYQDPATGAYYLENNRSDLGNATVKVAPVAKFDGAITADAAQQHYGFSQVVLKFNNPDILAGGVYDSFTALYEPGRCSDSGPQFVNPQRWFIAQDYADSTTLPNVNTVAPPTTDPIRKLQPQTWYRFRVHATYSGNPLGPTDDPANLSDSNTACVDAYTSPPITKYAGIKVNATPATTPNLWNGFTNLNLDLVTGGGPAIGSFTHYRIKVTPRPGQGAPNVSDNVSIKQTSVTSYTLTGLQPLTTYDIQVIAEYVCAATLPPQYPDADIDNNCVGPGGGPIIFQDGAQSTVSGRTEPVHPTGEGIVDPIQVVDPHTVNVSWTKPTNTAYNAVFNSYKIWKDCGSTPATTVAAKVDDPLYPNGDFPIITDMNQLTLPVNGLTANVTCCFVMRAEYQDQIVSRFKSNSTSQPVCATPVAPAPTSFLGVNKVTRLPAPTPGWTTVTVFFPADTADPKLTYYEVGWGPDQSHIHFCSDAGYSGCTANQIAASTMNQPAGVTAGTTLSMTIPDMAENTTYFVMVRAVNNAGPSYWPAPGDFSSSLPSPKLPAPPPTGDGLVSAGANGQTSVSLIVNIPSTTPAIGGYWTDFLLDVQQETTGTDLSNAVTTDYNTVRRVMAPNGVNAIPSTNVDYPSNGTCLTDTNFTFPTPPTGGPMLLRFCASAFKTPGGQNTIKLSGLNSNHFVYMYGRAVALENSVAGHFEESSTIVIPKSAAPQVTQPAFPIGGNPENAKDGIADVPDDSVNSPGGTCAFTGAILQGTGTTFDFTSIRVQLPPVTSGDCNYIEIGMWPDGSGAGQLPAGSPSFWAPFPATSPTPPIYRKLVGCQPVATHQDFTAADGIQKNTLYHIRARAYYSNGTSIVTQDGEGKECNHNVAPVAGTGDGITDLIVNNPRATGGACYMSGGSLTCYSSTDPDVGTRTSGPFKAKIVYQTPTNGGLWQHMYVWKATGSTQSIAAGNVLSRANDPVINKTSDLPFANGLPDTSTFRVDNNLTVDLVNNPGMWTCYLARAVYWDPVLNNYITSVNTKVACVGAPFTPPTIDIALNGAAKGAACGDGTSQVVLTMTSSVTGTDFDELRVYFSPTTPGTLTTAGMISNFGVGNDDSRTSAASAWEVVPKSDPRFDGSSTLTLGCNNRTFSGPGNYHIRAYSSAAVAGTADPNVKYASLTLAASDSNYVYIPTTASRLSYVMYAGRFEASVDNPANLLGGDVVYTDGSSTSTPVGNLAKCNQNFHDFSNSTGWDPRNAANSCGSINTTAKARSVKNVAPQAANWAQAWAACRNASVMGSRFRLPTDEERRRLAQWTADSPSAATAYSSMVSTYSTACNLGQTSAAAMNTGAATGCTTPLGLSDIGGNMKEWTDARVWRRKVNGDTSVLPNIPSIARTFGYTDGMTVVAQSYDNGLDHVIRTYHLLDPGTTGMALLMGNSYAMSSLDSSHNTTATNYRPIDPETETWADPTDGTGDHGFRCIGFIRAAAPTYAQLELPQETVFDTSDAPAGQPANWTIPVTKYFTENRIESVTLSGDATTSGTVTITWRPWTKSCGASCQNNFKYHVFRMEEPNTQDLRFTSPWATVATGSIYATATPLDPLAFVNGGNSAYYTTFNQSAASLASGEVLPLLGGTNRPIAGTDCSGSPTQCTFTDTLAGASGQSSSAPAQRMWDYILVVEDESHNFIYPRSQRYQSPYFTGDPANSTATTFKLQPRFRRAAIFAIDESWQNLRGQPQTMVYVPMDLSGADHDFYIQKYEATASGSFASGGVNPPGALASSTTWIPDAGRCHDGIRRARDFSSCNITTAAGYYMSKRNASPAVSVDFGGMYQGCAKSSVTNGTNAGYFLDLATNAQWTFASDQGDPDLSGKINQSPFFSTNTSIATVESSHCNLATPGLNNTGSDLSCVSRYGAIDMYGNASEVPSEMQYNHVGLDNGIDGLWRGTSTPVVGSPTLEIQFDLLRGLFLTSQIGANIPSSAQSGTPVGEYNIATSTPVIERGERYSGDGLSRGAGAARYAFDADNNVAPWWYTSPRCAF